MRALLLILTLAVVLLIAPGFLLDAPDAPQPPPSDAIVVISGDEQLARFREGLRLYRLGVGQVLVFSGAALDGRTSNADVMRDMAIQEGIPNHAILEEPRGEDTWGNAVNTRKLLEREGLRSAVLVTSPYHLRRAHLAFTTAYEGSGIQLTAHSAPDSEWRKLSWWREPETRRLTAIELQKLAYIAVTGKHN